jgi:hypothetical protein
MISYEPPIELRTPTGRALEPAERADVNRDRPLEYPMEQLAPAALGIAVVTLAFVASLRKQVIELRKQLEELESELTERAARGTS